MLRPENTSGRTKAQIVAEAEATWMLPVLIGEVEHGDICRCMRCFHLAADRLIKAQEEAINDGGTGAAGVPDGDELQAYSGPDTVGVYGQVAL